MKVENVYLVASSLNLFRPGEPSTVLGIKMVTPIIDEIVPLYKEPRICYHIRFEDGCEDYLPFEEVENGNAKFKTLKQIIADEINSCSK